MKSYLLIPLFSSLCSISYTMHVAFMPMIPIEAPSPFEGAFTEKEVDEFGLKKLSVEEAEKLVTWLKDKKKLPTASAKSAYSSPLFHETIQSVDTTQNSIRLLDNSIWEFPASNSSDLMSWYPGQRVAIRANTDPDFPYMIENKSSRARVSGIYLQGSSRTFKSQEPSFNFAVPVTAASIIQIDKGSGHFSMNDRTMWEIAPADLERVKELQAPTEIRYQKSLRKKFPFTFMDATSHIYFSAKPKLITQSVMGGFSSEGLKQVRTNQDSGGTITLDDESAWEIYPSNQETSFNWKEGDILEIERSERQDFPTKLVNQNDQSSVLAKPSTVEETLTPTATHQTPIYQEISVESISKRGKYLHLSDGTSYKVSAIDRGVVDLWLPDHKVEISKNKGEKYVSIKNLFMHEKVRAQKM